MTATEERNKPVDGRDVARRLSETGALDGLFEQIDSGEVEMTGARGLLPALLKEVLERGLRAELTEHLGYEKGEPTTSARGNARNGTTTKTIDSEVGPFETSGAPGPGRLVHAAPGAQGPAEDGRTGRDDHRPVRRGDDRARDPPPLGVHHRRGPEQGDDLEGHRRGAPVPSWSGSAGLRVAFYPVIHRGRDPRQGPRRPPGAGDARTRIAVGAGHGRRQARAGDLDPGRGGGLLEGRRVCADLANRGVLGAC